MRHALVAGPNGITLPILASTPLDGQAGDICALADGTYEYTGSAWRKIYGGSGSASPQYTAENKQGSTISAGQAVATHSSGVGVVLASAADSTKPAVGLMVADTLSTVSGLVQVGSVITMADWTAVIGAALLAAHAQYYLDPTTAGRLTATAPSTTGQVVQPVGRALSTTELELQLTPVILL